MNTADAIKLIIEHEGGYVNDPKDPGGETIYGISRRAHPKAWENGRPTIEDAVRIYRRKYWNHKRLKCSNLHPAIALCVFDCAVNQGVTRAAYLLQKAVKAKQDGWAGPKTAAKANRNPKRTMERFMAHRICKYAELDKDDVNDDLFDTFGEGWMVRTLRTYEHALGALND